MNRCLILEIEDLQYWICAVPIDHIETAVFLGQAQPVVYRHSEHDAYEGAADSAVSD